MDDQPVNLRTTQTAAAPSDLVTRRQIPPAALPVPATARPDSYTAERACLTDAQAPQRMTMSATQRKNRWCARECWHSPAHRDAARRPSALRSWENAQCRETADAQGNAPVPATPAVRHDCLRPPAVRQRCASGQAHDAGSRASRWPGFQCGGGGESAQAWALPEQ